MLCQVGIDPHVVTIQPVQQAAVALEQVIEKVDRFFKHRAAQGVVEAGKSFAVYAVVLFESSEVQPLTTELDGPGSRTLIRDHPLQLLDQGCLVAQFARPR